MAEPLVINLRDEVSAVLRGITRSTQVLSGDLTQINKLLRELDQTGGRGFVRVRQEVEKTNQALAVTGNLIKGIFAGIASYGVGRILQSLASSMTQIAESGVQMRSLMESTRLSQKEILQLQQGMERLGLSSKQADDILSGITEKIAELQQRGAASSLFQQLQQMPGGAEWARRLREQAQSGGMKSALDYIFSSLARQSDQAARQLTQALGGPLALRRLREAMQDNIPVTEANIAALEKYHKNMVTFEWQLSNVKATFINALMPTLNQFAQWLQTKSPEIEKFGEDLRKWVENPENWQTLATNLRSVGNALSLMASAIGRIGDAIGVIATGWNSLPEPLKRALGGAIRGSGMGLPGGPAGVIAGAGQGAAEALMPRPEPPPPGADPWVDRAPLTMQAMRRRLGLTLSGKIGDADRDREIDETGKSIIKDLMDAIKNWSRISFTQEATTTSGGIMQAAFHPGGGGGFGGGGGGGGGGAIRIPGGGGGGGSSGEPAPAPRGGSAPIFAPGLGAGAAPNFAGSGGAIGGGGPGGNWGNFLAGLSYLETSHQNVGNRSSSAQGFFQFLRGTAAQAIGAGLADPRAGGYGQQAAATMSYIQRFLPQAAQAIQRGDFQSAIGLLRGVWPSLPGGSQSQSAGRYRTFQDILGGGGPRPPGEGGQPIMVPGAGGGATPGQANRPFRMQGQVSIGGQTFDWASGGSNRGSIPYGSFPINIGTGDIGSVGQRIGSIATVGGLGGVIPDPKFPGRPREGIQIHPGSGATLDQLYTQGCFGVPVAQWPAFRATLLAEAAKNPGGLLLNIGPGGQASIVPRVSRMAPMQQSQKWGGQDLRRVQSLSTPVGKDAGLDRSRMAGDVKLGGADINVNVNAPRGTKVDADGDGAFEKIKVNRTPQMAKTGSGEGEWSNWSYE